MGVAIEVPIIMVTEGSAWQKSLPVQLLQGVVCVGSRVQLSAFMALADRTAIPGATMSGLMRPSYVGPTLEKNAIGSCPG